MLGECKPNLDVFFEGLIIQNLKRKGRSWREKYYCTMVVCTTHVAWRGVGVGSTVSLYLYLLGKLTNTWINKEESNKHLCFYHQELSILHLYMHSKNGLRLLLKVKTSHIVFTYMYEYVIYMHALKSFIYIQTSFCKLYICVYECTYVCVFKGWKYIKHTRYLLLKYKTIK